MARRNALVFDQEGLTKNLQASTGKGVGALFPSPPTPAVTGDSTPTPPTGKNKAKGGSPTSDQRGYAREPREPLRRRRETKDASVPSERRPINRPAAIEGEMARPALDDADIDALREPAYQAQTFRLTQEEIEWIKDTAYRLSKELRRGKVAQGDILRIAIKLFANLLASKKDDLITILEAIK